MLLKKIYLYCIRLFAIKYFDVIFYNFFFRLLPKLFFLVSQLPVSQQPWPFMMAIVLPNYRPIWSKPNVITLVLILMSCSVNLANTFIPTGLALAETFRPHLIMHRKVKTKCWVGLGWVQLSVEFSSVTGPALAETFRPQLMMNRKVNTKFWVQLSWNLSWVEF